ncbi:MAG TPA: DUF4410 domain-containing protein, partial [Thermoanaerobaculia bacterium]
EARKKKQDGANTEPGKYEKWGPDIDEIEIVKAFDASSYKNVVVVPVQTDDVKLPEKEDNTYEPVQKILASATDPFAEGLEKNYEAAKVKVDPKPGKGADTLLVRTKIEVMDPGSRAKRYFGGFGAGAARVKLSGEIVDAKSKAVLVRFTQERRSGFGVAGGSYEALLNRNLRAIGEDVANILKAF